MIEPPRRGEPYPALLPPVRTQWLRLSVATRVAIVVGPLVVVALAFAAGVPAGVTAAVLAAGAGAATLMFAKNRTDRHNAAVERGEILTVADPHLRPVTRDELGAGVRARLEALGYPDPDLGQVLRFDDGWLIKRRNRRDVAVVVGDDGGHALFDPRWVTDLWAAAEYQAGRGREPGVADGADGADGAHRTNS